MNELTKEIDFEDAIKFDEGSDELKVDTLFIAKAFEKEHKNVLRSTRKILEYVAEIEVENSRLSFELSDYQNSRGKTCTKYNLNQDAFLALVMDFSGDQAYRIKFGVLQQFAKVRVELAKVKSELAKTKKKAKAKAKQLEDSGFILVVMSGDRLYIEKTKLDQPENRVKGIQKLNPELVYFKRALASGNLKEDFKMLQENLDSYKGEYNWYELGFEEFSQIAEISMDIKGVKF